MITDEMIETGAKALVDAEYERNPSHKTLVSYARHDARAVLEAVMPMIRAEVLEECAKVADKCGTFESGDISYFIRAMKGTSHE